MPTAQCSRVFRFCDVSAKSLRMIELAIQTPDHIQPISILLYVVDVDIPAFICLYVLDGGYLLVEQVRDRLRHSIVASNDI